MRPRLTPQVHGIILTARNLHQDSILGRRETPEYFTRLPIPSIGLVKHSICNCFGIGDPAAPYPNSDARTH